MEKLPIDDVSVISCEALDMLVGGFGEYLVELETQGKKVPPSVIAYIETTLYELEHSMAICNMNKKKWEGPWPATETLGYIRNAILEAHDQELTDAINQLKRGGPDSRYAKVGDWEIMLSSTFGTTGLREGMSVLLNGKQIEKKEYPVWIQQAINVSEFFDEPAVFK